MQNGIKNQKIFEELIDYINRQPDIDMLGCITKTSYGIIGCIAGNLCLMKGYEPVGFIKSDCHLWDGAKEYYESFYIKRSNRACGTTDVAAEILGLNEEEAANLFHLNNWPNHMSMEYNACKMGASRKKVVIKRIKEFAGL